MAVKTRNIENGTVVWFGSKGKKEDGTAIKANNFTSQQQSVVSGLIQRLSVIKGELWYKMNFGQPLTDKVQSKILIDSFVTTTIKSHPDVIDVLSFESALQNRKYYCKVRISSIYGEVELEM